MKILKPARVIPKLTRKTKVLTYRQGYWTNKPDWANKENRTNKPSQANYPDNPPLIYPLIGIAILRRKTYLCAVIYKPYNNK